VIEKEDTHTSNTFLTINTPTLKKLIVCSIAAILLSNCQVSVAPKQAQAQPSGYHGEGWQDYWTNGMHYKVNYGVIGHDGGSHYGLKHSGYASVAIINITKDSLECAYYRTKMTPAR
jgi:hypothetical protein